MTRRGVWPLTGAALAAAASELTAIALTATATWLICRAAGQPPLAVLAVAIVLVRTLAIGRGAFRYVERLAGHDAVLRVMSRLRGRYFDALVPRGRAESAPRGDLLTGMVADVDAVQTLLLRAVLPAFSALLVGTVVCGWFATMAPVAALILACGLAVAGLLLPVLASVVLRGVDRRLVMAGTELADRTVDLVEGVEDLALNGAVAAALDRERAATDAVAAAQRRRARRLGAITAATTAVHLGTCALVGWAAMRAQAAGLVAPTTVAVVVLTALVTMEITTPLVAAGEQAGAVAGSLRRLWSVLRARPDTETADLAPPVPPVSVRLTDVTVRRPGERRPAVDSVSLSVPAGARVAVIGPTGAGKSTLLSLVLGLIAPSSGAVELNGRDIGRLPAADLYPRLVSGLPQDAYLFAGSIRANLLLAEPDASEERLWAVLARVGAEDWVRGLDLGLDTAIGPDSCLLAGGQRQRVALATTLLADPSVLVLDEPAESLDDAAADLVFDDIVRATRGRTAIVVSHRIRGLRRFDMIVVMAQGKIVQKGTHEDLITRPGFYREQYVAEISH